MSFGGTDVEDLLAMAGTAFVAAREIEKGNTPEMKTQTTETEWDRRKKSQKFWLRLNMLAITPGTIFLIFGIGAIGFHWWTIPAMVFVLSACIWSWMRQ